MLPVVLLILYIFSMPVVAFAVGKLSKHPGWEMEFGQVMVLSFFWPTLIVVAPLVCFVWALEKIFILGQK